MTLATAIQTGDVSQLPSRRDEDWRWTDLRGLIRTLPPRYEPKAGHGAFAIFRNDELYRSPFEATRQVTVLNGGIGGLGLGEAAPHVFDKHDPVVLLDVQTLGDISEVTALKITVPAGLSAVLLESHAGQGRYVTSLSLDIVVEAGGSLERVVLAEDDPEGVSIVDAGVSLAAGATYAQTVLTSGARRQRIETRIAHPGAGASVRLDGVYILRDQRHADLTTVVTHAGRDGTTSQLTKGVVRDQARGVFQGRIVVERGADGTEARMGHHALILSDKAEVDAKPELLIFADDVQCAHGNTIGALDEAAIFYARQRGMPEDVARAMLTEAFVGEVVDRIDDEFAREIARAWVSEQLGTGE
ncbi:MAG: Fe-S cluster assembly protein SufD [Caulobacter sp.]|nr:Fe-S cluster assembly protein SufD [Caulobacter sp.]